MDINTTRTMLVKSGPPPSVGRGTVVTVLALVVLEAMDVLVSSDVVVPRDVLVSPRVVVGPGLVLVEVGLELEVDSGLVEDVDVDVPSAVVVVLNGRGMEMDCDV
jgi:hypothetical protein